MDCYGSYLNALFIFVNDCSMSSNSYAKSSKEQIYFYLLIICVMFVCVSSQPCSCVKLNKLESIVMVLNNVCHRLTIRNYCNNF